MKQLCECIIDLKHKIKKQKEWEDGKIHSSWTTTKVKCLHQMFTVWSTKSADHWAGRPRAWFQQQGNKKGKILDPPFCRLPGRGEQMGHTQQNGHHCPPRQSSSLTTESTPKYSIFIQMLVCTHFVYLDFRQHYLQSFLPSQLNPLNYSLGQYTVEKAVINTYFSCLSFDSIKMRKVFYFFRDLCTWKDVFAVSSVWSTSSMDFIKPPIPLEAAWSAL